MFPSEGSWSSQWRKKASQHLGTIPVAKDDLKSRESFCGSDTLKLRVSIPSGTQSPRHCSALRYQERGRPGQCAGAESKPSPLWSACLLSTQAPPSLGRPSPWSLAVLTTFLCKHLFLKGRWHDQRWSNFPRDDYTVPETSLPSVTAATFRVNKLLF